MQAGTFQPFLFHLRPLKGEKQLKQKITAKQIALLLLGTAILSFGLYNVHSQSRITEGGVLGMTLFLQHWFGISPSISEIVLDILCYLLGMRYLGKDFLPCALTATVSFSLWYSLFENIGYLLPNLSPQPLLAAVVGGMFVGVGVGLVVRAGGASSGDDALALVISKVMRIDISRAYLLTDLIVLALSLSYIPLQNIACSLITVTLSSFLIGKIHSFGKKECAG